MQSKLSVAQPNAKLQAIVVTDAQKTYWEITKPTFMLCYGRGFSLDLQNHSLKYSVILEII